MKPVCVPCHRFFRIRKSGYYFIEGMPISGERGKRAKPGNEEPDKWKPYKVHVGDRWECEGCGAQILCGFGQGAIAEHYQPDFQAQVDRLGADQLQVNDC